MGNAGAKECLEDNRGQLCRLQNRALNADLHAVLQFCADVPPGNARAKECLEDNREQPGFSPACKTEVEAMMESRASDFRLDPKLRQLCADDIQVTPGTPACVVPVARSAQLIMLALLAPGA